MSAFYTTDAQPEDESLKTIARARELGVTMMDTADIYGLGKNEQLLGALCDHRRPS
jgi:aryl-alcohol dehydrogenase-like predicted oxidoreductase